MELNLSKTFKFDAAHFLPDYVGKCGNMHGHTWKLEVVVRGLIKTRTGMVWDFQEFKSFVMCNIIDKLDHSLLNNLIENPTAEIILTNIKIWMEEALPRNIELVKLVLWESSNSSVGWEK